MEAEKTVAKPDWLTVAAIAVVTHALSSSIHEAIGHGGTCIAVGCTPRLLTTMQFQGDKQSLPKLAVDAISAGGSVVNLVAAGIAILLLRRHRGPARTGWFFLWLFATACRLAILASGVRSQAPLHRRILRVRGRETYGYDKPYRRFPSLRHLPSSQPVYIAQIARISLVGVEKPFSPSTAKYAKKTKNT
jgi:hypothetical protein